MTKTNQSAPQTPKKELYRGILALKSGTGLRALVSMACTNCRISMEMTGIFPFLKTGTADI